MDAPSPLMTGVRRMVWTGSTGKANISPPKLQSLPQNINSDQCKAIPISSVHLETRRYPVEHGRMRGTVNSILTHVMFPTSVPPTPDYILRMIKCLYANCGSARCSCLCAPV